MAETPSVQDVRDWATVSAQSLTDDQIQQILDAETALQAAVCTVPETYPAALAQALLRRCAREIGARQLPLGLTADTSGEYSPVRLPNWDSEIERLEAPFRVIAVA